MELQLAMIVPHNNYGDRSLQQMEVYIRQVEL